MFPIANKLYVRIRTYKCVNSSLFGIESEPPRTETGLVEWVRQVRMLSSLVPISRPARELESNTAEKGITPSPGDPSYPCRSLPVSFFRSLRNCFACVFSFYFETAEIFLRGYFAEKSQRRERTKEQSIHCFQFERLQRSPCSVSSNNGLHSPASGISLTRAPHAEVDPTPERQ